MFIVNCGLFADAHSHPWQATPLLKTPAGRVGMWIAQRSPPYPLTAERSLTGIGDPPQ